MMKIRPSNELIKHIEKLKFLGNPIAYELEKMVKRDQRNQEPSHYYELALQKATYEKLRNEHRYRECNYHKSEIAFKDQCRKNEGYFVKDLEEFSSFMESVS